MRIRLSPTGCVKKCPPEAVQWSRPLRAAIISNWWSNPRNYQWGVRHKPRLVCPWRLRPAGHVCYFVTILWIKLYSVMPLPVIVSVLLRQPTVSGPKALLVSQVVVSFCSSQPPRNNMSAAIVNSP